MALDPIRIPMAGTEVARVRFAVSPVYETFMAVDALRAPGAHAVHLPWVRRAKELLAADPAGATATAAAAGVATATATHIDVPGLLLLAEFTAITPKPSFLLPVPDVRMPLIGAELKRIRAMSVVRAAAFVDNRVGRPSAAMQRFRDDPKTGLALLAETLGHLHDLLIEPSWPRILGVLEADIAHRAGILAEGGVEAVFAGLHPDVSWTGDEIRLLKRTRSLTKAGKPGKAAGPVILDGRPLVLSPSAFAWPDVWVATRPSNAGVLRYPARGIATIWETRRPAPSALEALIGRTRAEILVQLSEPQTTSALSVRLGVTSGAVSQHLGVLRGAGLVATRREGRAVLHLRTDRAEALLR